MQNDKVPNRVIALIDGKNDSWKISIHLVYF